ncbi:ABC transporter permease [Pseudoflavitalea rhizosphaerae]|uniref:ABC transporter permease n=1 Tax=Pseudoflavitalea rhizosphaerae TaxID=1884793 RepID=UPI000F8EABA8|nr:ABC transporter permease [Pseudoflavitalea rhizosphaerae]
MLRNYFIIAWRNIIKNRFYSTINVIGLSAGIAFTLLVAAFIWSQLQVNKHLKNANRQYIIQSKWKDPGMGQELTTIEKLPEALKREYPHLVANYYHWDGVTTNVSKGDRVFREGLQVGDSSFLSTYGFKLLHGNASTALADPFSAVITAEKARKYFGRTDVVGETLSIENFSGSKHDFMITAVMDDQPANSVITVNDDNANGIFLPFATSRYLNRQVEGWDKFYLVGYVELQPGVQAAEVDRAMLQLVKSHAPAYAAENLQPYVVSLKEYYLSANNGLIRKMLYALSATAIFILLMAVINFINMAVSRSSSRMREIGIRKVMGGLKQQLIGQFLVESILLVFFAMLLALFLYVVATPFFNTMLGTELPGLGKFPVYFIAYPLLLTLVIGIMAGIYPAFVLSSLKSVDAVKGKLASIRENILLRKSFLGFQFLTAAVVLIAAYIINQQMNLFFGRSLGFDKEFVIAAQAPRNWCAEGVEKMENIRKRFELMPQVQNISLSYEVPDGKNSGTIDMYNAGADSTSFSTAQTLFTDERYAQTYNIPMAAGVFYSADGFATDPLKIVVNESQAKALGYAQAADAIGRQVKLAGWQQIFTIAGVTKDFHFGSMQQAIQPAAFFQVKLISVYRYFSFKIKPGSIANCIEALEREWAALMPGSAFEYQFMDDRLKLLYKSELRLQKASMAATVLSVIIVLLGVTGLVSLSVQKRTREIGVRKVLGSPVSSIIRLFLKEFLGVMLIACIAACPIAFLMMQKWLNGYAYRIDITVLPFLVCIGSLLVVTALLIIAQTIRAAMANPVNGLKTE